MSPIPTTLPTASRLSIAMVFSMAMSLIGCGQPIHTPERMAQIDTACADLACTIGCCGGACMDLNNDSNNCGQCGTACSTNQVCQQAACTCKPGFTDCDGDSVTGCETFGACLCPLGATQRCYTGAAETEGVGPCSGGTQICMGNSWAACRGQVIPVGEPCEPNGIDDDCNGVTDDDTDADSDGWGRCSGDCCDSLTDICAQEPALVNPGAFDFHDNLVDDDCDGTIDNAPEQSCSTSAVTSGTGPINLVQAMDLCQFTAGDPHRWGVINSQLLNANGMGAPDDIQVGVLESLGAGTLPSVNNETMVVLSSGRARGVGDPGYPGYMDTSYATSGSSVSAPEVFLTAHANTLQTNAACPGGNTLVNDSVLFRTQLRVPTNAQGIEFQFRFFSFEYPTYLCSEYNDFFLALLDSEHPDIPADHNISFDANENPVSINNAFFTSCVPRQCFDSVVYPLQEGPDIDQDGCVDSHSCNPETNLCENDLGACPDGSDALLAFSEDINYAGATGWLTTSAPVVPGEVITLDFYIWDTGDKALDSLVLIDNFRWLLEPTEVITKY